MRKEQFIADLTAGGGVDTVLLIASAQQNQARNGPYWRISFRDSSGSIESKIWSPLSLQFPDIKAGQLVQVQGRVTVYRDKNEISVDTMRILSKEEEAGIDLADFTVSSGHDPDVLLAQLELLCRENMQHAPWKKFYKYILKDEAILAGLRVAPAAKAMHHAYTGGLLEHTLGVCRLCIAFADLYPYLDRQVLLAGALCHDLGKIWEMSSGLVIDYTDSGRLLGHMTIVLEKVAPYLHKSGLEDELVEHFKHLILSHHGTREFGSPCLPATAEAMALHQADNTDAKLNQMQGALNAVPEGEPGWSNYISGLDRAVFRAVPSPSQVAVKTTGRKAVQESQCSLLLKE